eukprot:TRINITY_DN1087_c0_g1_i1.p1 TRINITY_DN1087_c0_g1~~TRINITY_DN1087_c0_g1_i1.p1  ORF type:complete len:235 (+),score=41.15 TRINITY_DN1087_c0_g1_i1:69-773(+)
MSTKTIKKYMKDTFGEEWSDDEFLEFTTDPLSSPLFSESRSDLQSCTSEERSRHGDDYFDMEFDDDMESIMGDDVGDSEWLQFVEDESENIILSEIERQKFLMEAEKGVLMNKHGRKGFPRPRKVQIIMKDGLPSRLTWKGAKSVELCTMSRVSPGKNTRVLKRHVAKDIHENLCFSIYLMEEKESRFRKTTIDFQARNEEERDKWVMHLNGIIQDAKLELERSLEPEEVGGED